MIDALLLFIFSKCPATNFLVFAHTINLRRVLKVQAHVLQTFPRVVFLLNSSVRTNQNVSRRTASSKRLPVPPNRLFVLHFQKAKNEKLLAQTLHIVLSLNSRLTCPSITPGILRLQILTIPFRSQVKTLSPCTSI